MKTETTFEYENYVNNIYEKQSENSIENLLSMFARENGYEFADIKSIVNDEELPVEYNAWQEPIYTKQSIRKLIQKIIK